VVRSESFGRSLHGSRIRFDRSRRPGRCGQPLRQQHVAAADIENVSLVAQRDIDEPRVIGGVVVLLVGCIDHAIDSARRTCATLSANRVVHYACSATPTSR